MGTNEPTAGRPGDDGHGAAGDPYGGYPPHPAGPSYSGYREGVHGEPVPDSAWQEPAGTAGPQPYPPGPYPPSPYGVPPGSQPYHYPPGPYPYPPYRPTNAMAVASLVLGILWLYWIGSILALVFGYLARQQIRERGESGDGMAVAGIVLGWIGVGVLTLFVLLLAVGGFSSEFQ